MTLVSWKLPISDGFHPIKTITLSGNENDLLILNWIILFSGSLYIYSYGRVLPPLSLSTGAECFSIVLMGLVWWWSWKWAWRMKSSATGWWWWWWWSATAWCGDSFGTGWDRCERWGIVSEGVCSSGVKETWCTSDGVDAEGGRNLCCNRKCVRVSQGNQAKARIKGLVGNTLSVSGGWALCNSGFCQWSSGCLLHQLHEDGGCKCDEERAGWEISIRDAASDCLSKESRAFLFPFKMCTYTHTHPFPVCTFIHTEVRTHNESVISHCWDRLNSKAVPQPFHCWKMVVCVFFFFLSAKRNDSQRCDYC